MTAIDKAAQVIAHSGRCEGGATCPHCRRAAHDLHAAGLLVTPTHDAEQQRIGAEAALAYVKAEALDPRQAATEGPLVGRILVAHWCDKAASTGAGGLEREGGSDV